MDTERQPHEIIADLVESWTSFSDDEVLAELSALAPLPDEDDPAWERDTTWQIAYRFVALAEIAALRHLKPAIQLLLDRASYGDPGEMFRNLRHYNEEIIRPHWSELADICLGATKSSRLGTRLWAIDQLAVLEDERARPAFEASIRSDPEEIQWIAKIGLERLDANRGNA